MRIHPQEEGSRPDHAISEGVGSEPIEFCQRARRNRRSAAGAAAVANWQFIWRDHPGTRPSFGRYGRWETETFATRSFTGADSAVRAPRGCTTFLHIMPSFKCLSDGRRDALPNFPPLSITRDSFHRGIHCGRRLDFRGRH
jgi:hypothetical protein